VPVSDILSLADHALTPAVTILSFRTNFRSKFAFK
jgi:hypothetical protein